MPFFTRKKNRKRKIVSKPITKKTINELVDPADDNNGYNPYDTLPGVPREKFGMRRQDDDKWSF